MESQRSLVIIVAVDFAFGSEMGSQVGADLLYPSIKPEKPLGFSMI